MTTSHTSVRPLEAAAEVTRRLVVATADGLVVDGRAELGGHDIVDVAIDPVSGAITALAADGAVHLGDAGRWTHVATVPDGPHRVMAWHGSTLLVGGANASLWQVTRAGEVKRIDALDVAPTHEGWHTPWGGPPDVFSLASDGHEAFVNVHVGGILRSSDLDVWTPTIDLHTDVHDVAIDDAGTVWAATGMGGLARSTDRGASWTHFTDGLHASYARAVAVIDGGALVSVSSGPFGRDGGVYRFDGEVSTPIATLGEIDGSIDRGGLVADGGLVAVALPSGEIAVSADRGGTWHTAMSGVEDVRAIALRAST